ncbi:MAG: PTS transporter subunit EIIB, partial [Clostridium sp.]|nr:PTS transporter subunit EIIB [Clostridium sp.]
PGRGDDVVSEDPTSSVVTKSSLNDEAKVIIEALGGPDNIEDVDACITRLRVSVKSADLVKKDVLKGLGATDVLEVSGGVQAVYGAKAILYKNIINDLLGNEE